MSKSVIDREEEPTIATLRDYRLGQARGQGIAVIDPGCFGWRAIFARKGCAPHCSGNGNSIVICRELLHGEGNGRVIEADDDVDLFRVEPLSRNGGPNIGLAL